MQEASSAWTNWRRPLDYYDEDVLNWLWVDVLIRQQTQGKKSIDDFCKLFHGAPSGPPMVKTYTFDDVVNALNQVAPYDWRKFWTERLTNHGPGAPLGGIEGSGWKIVYDGTITDTVENMIAAKAGIGPGMRVIAVNGRRFSNDVWRDALRAGKTGKEPLELIVENTDYYRTFKLDYHEGEKYPHLVRDESKPDVLSEIIKAR
jgi:predicted metalloprotease with PDZ domain